MKPDPLHEAQRARCLTDPSWKYTKFEDTNLRERFTRMGLFKPKESNVKPINSAPRRNGGL